MDSRTSQHGLSYQRNSAILTGTANADATWNSRATYTLRNYLEGTYELRTPRS